MGGSDGINPQVVWLERQWFLTPGESFQWNFLVFILGRQGVVTWVGLGSWMVAHGVWEVKCWGASPINDTLGFVGVPNPLANFLGFSLRGVGCYILICEILTIL